ncbi:MAG: rhodanese-like domain-containing protein [Desulfobulbus sp.]|jgi:rhodanese-related sulfurtransferase|nr:MAG: rhodanese-like domain-containing protein [Desulfobulbus sp.]
MKSRIIILLAVFCLLPLHAGAETLDEYLARFDLQERKEMKITSKELVELLKKGEVQLIDIRFPEEFQAWRMGAAINIPLNELPGRLQELDKNKLIVTACPHNDRANLARIYLTTKGYKAKYLTDGLLGLADALRGDAARDLIKATAR